SRRVWLPIIGIAAALTIYIGLLPRILERFVGAPFPAKIVVSAVLLVPLGFLMGMPFPTGLRVLAEERGAGSNSIEWAWAMNAASSVLGSVVAIAVAIEFGLNATLACGAAAYGLALLTENALRSRTSPA